MTKDNLSKQVAFWARLTAERRRRRLTKPDFVLGDFNITEDAIDRSPPHRAEPSKHQQPTPRRNEASLGPVKTRKCWRRTIHAPA